MLFSLHIGREVLILYLNRLKIIVLLLVFGPKIKAKTNFKQIVLYVINNISAGKRVH